MKNSINDSQVCGTENSRCETSRFQKFLHNHKVAVVVSLLLMAAYAIVYFFYCRGCCLTPFDHLQSIIVAIAGAVATVYIVHSVVIFWFHPIKRDWILSEGRYIGRVVLFVLFVPVALTFWISVVNNSLSLAGFGGFDYSQMMYVREMYGDSIEAAPKCEECNSDLGQVSLCEKCGAEEHSPSLLWMVFYHFIDPGNQHTTLSLIGRILAGICAVLGVVLLNGLLVSVLVGWFDSKREKWNNGDARYTKYLRRRKHYVIIGGGDMDVYVVKSIFDKVKSEARGIVKYPYILIQASSNVEKLRNDIYSVLDDASQKRHVVIYRGDRTSRSDVQELSIESALDIYIIGDVKNHEKSETMHDTFNMRCLEYVTEFAVNKPTVYVMFECQTTFSVYQFSDISDDIKSKVVFKPVNFYEMWAQKLFVQPAINNAPHKEYLPLEGKEGISADSEEFVHLVVVGMSRMGVALGVEAAHLAHYPNFVTKQKRTRITFIDANMKQHKNYFMGRFNAMFELARYRYLDFSTLSDNEPITDLLAQKWVDPAIKGGENGYKHLGENFIDIEWEFINGSIETPAIQQYLVEMLRAENKSKLTIAVCQDEPNVAVASAIYLSREIFLSENLRQVLVYQRFDDSLFSKLSKLPYKTPFHGKLKAFGMIAEGFDLDLLNCSQDVSLLISDAYSISKGNDNNKPMAEFFAQHNDLVSKTLDALKHPMATVADGSLAEKNLEKMQGLEINYGKTAAATYWSNIYGANALWIRRRCVAGNGDISKTDVETLKLMSEVEHNRWNAEQLLMSYMPLDAKEQDVFLLSETLKAELQQSGKKIDDVAASEAYKYRVKDIYKAMMKHSNICSFDRLKEVDNESIKNDTYIVLAADYIYDKLNK